MNSKFAKFLLSKLQLTQLAFTVVLYNKSEINNANFKYIIWKLSTEIVFNADFSGAKLTGAIFDDAYANGANFQGAQLDNASFKNAELELANFQNASLKNVTFESAYMVHAELSKRQILESKFCDNAVRDAMKFSSMCKNQ